MDFKEYEERAITTRVYSPKVAMPYVVLGLCGESGEFFEKLLQQENDEDLVKKEIGDCLWYAAAIRVELGLPEIMWPCIEEMGQDDGFVIQAHIGIIAEQMKKYLRDDWKEDIHVELSQERKEKIHAALVVVLTRLQAITHHLFKVPLMDIAKENIEKLAKRKQENKIHGSGDCR